MYPGPGEGDDEGGLEAVPDIEGIRRLKQIGAWEEGVVDDVGDLEAEGGEDDKE